MKTLADQINTWLTRWEGINSVLIPVVVIALAGLAKFLRPRIQNWWESTSDERRTRRIEFLRVNEALLRRWDDDIEKETKGKIYFHVAHGLAYLVFALLFSVLYLGSTSLVVPAASRLLLGMFSGFGVGMLCYTAYTAWIDFQQAYRQAVVLRPFERERERRAIQKQLESLRASVDK